ncbi:MAG TPA: YciI family protein [Steroidobacteraceae bacterium]|nr:YciI family protein [Steroidobacteraceae bacterium]
MSYMLLIVEPLGQRADRSLQEGRDTYQRMLDYAESLRSQGVLVECNSLNRNAVRLNKQAGKTVITDGPFTEAKELVGGFFLLNCETREEALRHAQQCPAAEWATIEVRGVGPCYE